jgi:hypothetical protein
MGYVIEHNGKTVELPVFGDIATGVLRKARLESESDQAWFILENVLDAKALAVIDTLPLSEFAKHVQAWTNGVSLGE